MYLECFQCQMQNPEGSKFCKGCGALLHIEQQAAPIEPDLPPANSAKEPFAYRAGRFWARQNAVGRFGIVMAGITLIIVPIIIALQPGPPSPEPYISPLDKPSASSASRSSATSKPPNPQPASPDLSTYAKEHPEYALASIDNDVQLPFNDPRIAIYKRYLDFLAKSSKDSRDFVADITSRCVQVAQKQGTRRESLKTNLGFLAEMYDFYSVSNKGSLKYRYEDAAKLLLLANSLE